MIAFYYIAIYYGSLNKIGRERHTYTITVVGLFIMKINLLRNDGELEEVRSFLHTTRSFGGRMLQFFLR
jgi:hypothetical protein